MVHRFWTPPNIWGCFCWLFTTGDPCVARQARTTSDGLRDMDKTGHQHPGTASFKQSYWLEMTSLLPIEDVVLRKVRAAKGAFLREFWFDHPHGVDSEHPTHSILIMLGWAPHGDHGVDVSHIQDDGSAFMWWYHFCHELRPVKIEEPPCQLAWSVLVPSANHAMCGIVWGGNYPILLHTNTVELLFCSGLGAKVVAI